jgi:3-hydroxyacyl-CoA dehydrogenase/enoyl-CoA hydratase/carnithine racemase
MGLPEMTLGILPGAGGTQRVTRLVGLTEGLTMMNSSETRDAYTALQRGLVDRVVAPAKLLAEAQKEAEFLADLEGRDLQKFLKEHRTLQRKITPTLMEQVGLNAGYHTAVIGLAAGAAIGFGVFAWLTSFAWAIPLGIVGAALVAAASLWVVPGNARLFYSNIDGAIDKSGHPEYRHNIHQIVDAALYGYRNGPKAGLAREARNFGEVATRPLAKFMTLLALRKFGGAKMDMVFDMARQAGVENPEQYAKPRKLEKIGIAGPGTMGAGTGYVAAYNGLPVVLKGINAADVANGFKRVQADFDERVSGDKMDPREAAKKMALVTGTFDDAEFAKSGATIVSDNILVPGKSYEWNEKYKEGLYAKWGKAFPEGTIFVANTSASLVTPMAKATGRPGRVLGLHLFNPPKALPLAELILPDTKDFTPKDWRDLLESVATVLDFCKKTGRLVVVMNDREAFVVNRALLPYIDQANHLIAEGAPIEQIDRVMKGLGLPMGPLELADHIGFILGVEIGEYLPGKYDYMKDTSPILAGLYSMGLMGKFWGDKGGYYTYKKEKDRKTKKEELKPDHPKNELMVEAEAAGRAWERSVQKLRQWSKLQADKDANKPVQDADLAAADAEARAAVRAHAEALLSELGDPEGSAPENAGLANIRAVRDDGSQHMIAGEVERTLLAAEARIVRSTRPAQRKISDREIEQRLRYLMINEGARMLAEGVVDSPAEVDIAMTAGMGWPTSSGGLMRTADQDGVANVVAALRRYAQRYGPIFEPSPWLVERAEQGRRIYE